MAGGALKVCLTGFGFCFELAVAGEQVSTEVSARMCERASIRRVEALFGGISKR
jgi:hypothetical protein